MSPVYRGDMRLALLFFVVGLARGAVLQGVVLDEDTGNPLARTSVTLTPLAGTDARSLTIRTGERGSFSMLSVRAGWYVLKTSRKGYADAEAGQLRPGRPGIPFEVLPETQSSFFQLRMQRLAAVTGSLLDENNVGLPDLPVHVYTARKPIRRVAEGKTDDRGVFRVGGLEPGRYLVRSGSGQLEDGSGVIPTWYKYGVSVETAEAFRLQLGETQQDAVIRPQPGRLFTISGILSPPPQRPEGPVRLTIITDTGRRLAASAAGPFEIANVPPGPLELVAEGFECGNYSKLVADRDLSGLRIGCNPLYRPMVDWLVTDRARANITYSLLVRRVDLDSASAAAVLRTNELILPGHYELMVQTSPKHYAQTIRVNFGGQPITKQDGWFGLDFGNQVRLAVTLSDTPASIAGRVTASGKPVAGAVVYLELFNATAVETRLQLWTTRSDHTGKYQFAGLTPGSYRLISTFDFDPEDRFALKDAKVAKVSDGETGVVELELQLR